MTRRPTSGPCVFPSQKDDVRPVSWVPAISLTGERVWLKVRFPAATSALRHWSDKPVVAEVMPPVVYHARPMMADPYHLPGASDEERVAAIVELQQGKDAA